MVRPRQRQRHASPASIKLTVRSLTQSAIRNRVLTIPLAPHIAPWSSWSSRLSSTEFTSISPSTTLPAKIRSRGALTLLLGYGKSCKRTGKHLPFDTPIMGSSTLHTARLLSFCSRLPRITRSILKASSSSGRCCRSPKDGV